MKLVSEIVREPTLSVEGVKEVIEVHRWRRCRWPRRGTYRITARPQFRVKLAACGGRAAAAARSVAPEIVFGRGRTLSGTAPQSPCGRARAPASPRQPSRRRTNTRVRERARRCTSQRCAYFGRERAPGRVGRAARALAAVLWWWCVALLRLVALCAPPPGPSPPPSARAAEDAPSAAACASAPSNTTEPSPPPEPPDPPAHTEWWWAGACVGAAVLVCAAAGALARPHLRRRHAAAAAAAANPVSRCITILCKYTCRHNIFTCFTDR
ncbi:uncharacterized protein LOC111359172 [Spodoptera litura]|uniref:Uncharacterized protein LOC111359172 n=1 Tax=Spodoptera litura TaxID=69820 RepID=A0A9J7IYP4_SPOLT|nr:uncharacterized protein LOC111359172 [Spodoptera litura]